MKDYIKKYDHFYVLVCNIPSADSAGQYEKDIISGLTRHWKKKGYSEENLHIIYLGLNESGSFGKFECLQHCTQHSKFWIVGHSHPGSVGVATDKMWESPDGTVSSRVHGVDYIISLILEGLITHGRDDCYCDVIDTDKIARFKSGCFNYIKICVTSCFSGLPVYDALGNVIEPSLIQNFYSEAMSGNNFGKRLLCYVIGYKGLVVPISMSNSGLWGVFYEKMKKMYLPTGWFETPLGQVEGTGVTKRILRVVAGSGSYDWGALLSSAKEDAKVVLGVSPEPSVGSDVTIKEFPYSEYKKLKKLQRRLPVQGATGVGSATAGHILDLPSSSDDDDDGLF